MNGPIFAQRCLRAGHINLLFLPLQKISGHEISILQDPTSVVHFNSLAMATVDLSYVQFWEPPLNPLSSKRRAASLHKCKNGKSGSTTSSRNQPVSLDDKANEILERDNQPNSAAAPAQYQGYDFAIQQEGGAVGAQGTKRKDSRDEPS